MVVTYYTLFCEIVTILWKIVTLMPLVLPLALVAQQMVELVE